MTFDPFTRATWLDPLTLPQVGARLPGARLPRYEVAVVLVYRSRVAPVSMPGDWMDT
jgi:hypothetical protein